jgi:hypothetical protein
MFIVCFWLLTPEILVKFNAMRSTMCTEEESHLRQTVCSEHFVRLCVHLSLKEENLKFYFTENSPKNTFHTASWRLMTLKHSHFRHQLHKIFNSSLILISRLKYFSCYRLIQMYNVLIHDRYTYLYIC